MVNQDILYKPYVDYSQSANTLFHFVKKFDYLKTILLKRAIIPRYCIETIDYLGIENNGIQFKNIAVLQKCFCDIPFHKLAETFYVTGTGTAYEELSEAEKNEIGSNNTHFVFYGEFAIGFSKTWGEKNDLQPIHYLNQNATFSKHFKQILVAALADENLHEEYAEDLINRLTFLKPLRGIMQRSFEKASGERVIVDLFKNFHDECEWRYVPEHTVASRVGLENIIGNPQVTGNQALLQTINQSIENIEYEALWIKYDFDDIRYLIVPDSLHRIELIKTISSIPDDMFPDQENILLQKQVLMSKILVLEEIRKDW